jgi:hypothetical protein
MIAAVLRKTGSPLELIDDLVSEPLRAGQVKVKIFYSGLCRSQLMEIDGLRGNDNYLPHLLGHEGVGIILEVGKFVTKVKPNDIVVLTWIKGQGLSESGTIYRSKIGKINSGPIVTLCTHANISEDRVFKIDSNIPLTVAAILGCAVATGAGMAIKFNENIQKLSQHNDRYQNTLINGKNTVELYLNIVKDNDHLSESISKDSNIVLVNERKTYYEEQGINNIFWWKSFWNRIYLVLFLSFIIICFLFSKMSWIQIGGLIVLFGIFPFTIGFLISGGRWLREQWNQNIGIVYKNMYFKM